MYANERSHTFKPNRTATKTSVATVAAITDGKRLFLFTSFFFFIGNLFHLKPLFNRSHFCLFAYSYRSCSTGLSNHSNNVKKKEKTHVFGHGTDKDTQTELLQSKLLLTNKLYSQHSVCTCYDEHLSFGVCSSARPLLVTRNPDSSTCTMHTINHDWLATSKTSFESHIFSNSVTNAIKFELKMVLVVLALWADLLQWKKNFVSEKLARVAHKWR